MPGRRIQVHGMKSFGTADQQKGIMAVSEYLDESPLAQRGAAASKLWIWVMGLLRAQRRGGWDGLRLRENTGKLV